MVSWEQPLLVKNVVFYWKGGWEHSWGDHHTWRGLWQRQDEEMESCAPAHTGVGTGSRSVLVGSGLRAQTAPWGHSPKGPPAALPPVLADSTCRAADGWAPCWRNVMPSACKANWLLWAVSRLAGMAYLNFKKCLLHYKLKITICFIKILAVSVRYLIGSIIADWTVSVLELFLTFMNSSSNRILELPQRSVFKQRTVFWAQMFMSICQSENTLESWVWSLDFGSVPCEWIWLVRFCFCTSLNLAAVGMGMAAV